MCKVTFWCLVAHGIAYINHYLIKILPVVGWNVSVAGSINSILFGKTHWAIFDTIDLWVNMTPLGSPVVPDENGRMATSSS